MRIALPKGRLLPGVLQVMAGFGFDFPERAYTAVSREITAKLVKARAIPQLVAHGIVDLGCVGLDCVADRAYENAVPLRDLGLNRVEIMVALARSQRDLLLSPPPRPLVIATEYPGIGSRWAQERGLAHILVETFGSTEGYAPDLADVVIDCVETGATMEANGLVIVEHLMTSTTWLIANRLLLEDPDGRRKVEAFVGRLALASTGGETP
jgi:ATP phosphoribosyltransferase